MSRVRAVALPTPPRLSLWSGRCYNSRFVIRIISQTAVTAAPDTLSHPSTMSLSYLASISVSETRNCPRFSCDAEHRLSACYSASPVQTFLVAWNEKLLCVLQGVSCSTGSHAATASYGYSRRVQGRFHWAGYRSVISASSRSDGPRRDTDCPD
jgi:hypothetical protein